MGSTGSGSFTDYSKRKSTILDGTNGGTSGNDDCGKAFTTNLEDISRCFYFINKHKVPSVDTEVSVFFNGVRLSIESKLGEEIGYLPTKYNYLKNCIADGIVYKGSIRSSSLTPIPSIIVDITPV